MDLFLQQLCNGLVIGSTYAVVALGFALAFSVLRVVHFAHPDIFMVGMFAGLVAANAVPWLALPIALLAGAAGAGLIGYMAERAIIGPLRGRDMLTTLIGTLGLSIVLQNGMALIVGPDPVPFPALLPRKFIDIGPVMLTLRQLADFVLSLFLLALVSAFVRLTRTGRATRAIADRPDVRACAKRPSSSRLLSPGSRRCPSARFTARPPRLLASRTGLRPSLACWSPAIAMSRASSPSPSCLASWKLLSRATFLPA